MFSAVVYEVWGISNFFVKGGAKNFGSSPFSESLGEIRDMSNIFCANKVIRDN